MSSQVPCIECHVPIPLPAPGAGEILSIACPSCATDQEVVPFPSLRRPMEPGRAPALVVAEGEAACFFHPRKKAEVPCDACGRFLCALCDLEMAGRHLCSPCLESARRQGGVSELETRRFLFDSAALTLAVVPILIWPFTLVSAPMALFLAIRSFRAPGSLIPRSRLRSWLAILLATAQIVGWVAILVALLRNRS